MRGAAALVAASAANQIAWQEASLRPLGRRFGDDGPLWTCPLATPDIWHTAIARTDDVAPTVRAVVRHLGASRYVSLCDTYAALDLRPLGLERRAVGEWWHRPAAPWPTVHAPDGIELRRVDGPGLLAAMEQAAAEAFAAPVRPMPGTVHPPALLDDPDAVVVVALDGPIVVGTAMGHVGAGVLGVYGVGTIPSHRGRGVATALTAMVGALRADLDAVLQPSPPARPLYRGLGFAPIGEFGHWQRPGDED